MSNELSELLEQQKALLVAVATGGPRIQDKQHEYTERRYAIRERLTEAGLADPIPFGDLWQWYGKWSDGTLPTYQSRRQYIAELIQPTIDALSSGAKPQVPSSLVVAPQAAPPEASTPLDIFVSHSGADAGLARLLADLLRNALNLAPERIRCTSVDGYRLEVGANTNERLRIEVREARAFILSLPGTVWLQLTFFSRWALAGVRGSISRQFWLAVLALPISRHQSRA
jgi:hypothetical protein